MDGLRNLILNTKLWGIAAALMVVLMVALGVAGNVLGSRLAAEPVPYRQAGVIVKSAGLVLAFGLAFSIAPLMARAVLGFQVHIGNGQVPIVAFLLRHESDIVLGLWTLWILGAVVVGPTIVRELILRD